MAPAGPAGPGGPGGPGGPVGPGGPAAPEGPWGPGSPFRPGMSQAATPKANPIEKHKLMNFIVLPSTLMPRLQDWLRSRTELGNGG